MKKRERLVELNLTVDELVNLEVAVRLRVEALEDNGDKDDYGWKPLHRRLLRARAKANI